jgi:hypothetical protein
MSRTLTALLACWMAVLATGTVVSHRHAAPAGHAHGYGWVAVAPVGDAPADALPHHHFVLAGIEFGAIPGVYQSGGDAQVLAAGILADAEDAEPLALASADWCSPPAPRPVAAPVPTATHLCAVARHARTGVLLS